MNLETVLYEVVDGVAVVTLNRPEAMNAWTPQLSDELNLAMGAADEDDNVRAVVVTGAGKAFCAGADLSGGEGGFRSGNAGEQPGKRLLPYKVRKPVIAAINGHAVGVGITYPLLCDIRIASDSAKIQFAMVRRGVIPELGSHVLLPRIIGFSKAADLLLTGRLMVGVEAKEWGVVSEVLPADQILPRAMEIARDIAVNTAPVSSAIAKQLMWRGLTMPVDEMIQEEGRLLQHVINGPDSSEGVRAFFERRDPQWTMTVSTDMPPSRD
jgi:enoyl-CoA hydratase/carnithine racemase